MTSYVISSGQTSQYDLQSGDTLKVLSGGVSDNSTVEAGAHEYVSSGGVSEDDYIYSGGALTLSAGAVAQDADIYSGGVLTGAGLIEGYAYDYGQVTSASVAAYLYDYGQVSALRVLNSGNVYVYGSAVGDVVSSGGAEVVESGAIDSRARVLSGGELQVQSGATVVSATVASGGIADLVLVVSNGALTIDPVVSKPTRLDGVTLASGAILEVQSAIVSSGATLTLDTGASAQVDILAGGRLYGPGVISGEVYAPSEDYGLISGAQLGLETQSQYLYGYLNVESGGVAAGVDIAFGELVVSSGGRASRTLIENGSAVVLSGGVASGTVVEGYFGDLLVSAGGIVSRTVVGGGFDADGDLDDVYGSAVDTVISASGDELIESGGFGSGTIVSSGGVQTVASGGEVRGVTVLSGGTEVLSAGASGSGVVVSSGGTLQTTLLVSGDYTLRANPLAASVLVSGVTIRAGGSLDVIGANVLSGGVLTLAAGAVASAVVVAAGGVLKGPGALGGYATGSSLDYGIVTGVSVGDQAGDYGVLVVASGGVITSVVLEAGQIEVQSGGRAVDTLVEDVDGVFIVDAGGQATATVIASGDGVDQSAEVYGLEIDAVVSSGGIEAVEAGGTARGAKVSSGGQQLVSSGGIASATQVLSGGLEVIRSGGEARGVTVASGGTVDLAAVISAGVSFTLSASPLLATTTVLDGVTVSAGGALYLPSATVDSRGTLVLAAGALASAVTVLSGGRLDGPGELAGSPSLDDGVVSGVSVGDTDGGSGSLVVQSTGVAAAVTVVDGALIVSSGGRANGTVVDAAGELIVAAGGLATDSIVGKGGAGAQDLVYGSGSHAVLSSGATEYVEAGGVASGTVVSSGAREVVLRGGSADGTVVMSGGVVVVSAGATTAGIVVSSGGEADIATVISSGVSFTLPASPLSSAVTFDGVTVDVGGSLEIVSAEVMSAGIFTLAAGAAASDVTIDAGGRLNGPGALEGFLQQASYDDGVVSGATVGDAAGPAQLFVGSGGSALGVTVSSGLLGVSAGGLASATTVGAGGLAAVYVGGSAAGLTVDSGGGLLVSSGGIVSTATVSSGGLVTFAGDEAASGASLVAGQVSAATVSGGVDVLAGGVIDYSGLTLLRGASLTLDTGGVAQDTTVALGATLSGVGTLIGDTRDAGAVTSVTVAGLLDVFGKADGVQVGDSSGEAGDLDVEAGASTYGARLVSGVLTVSSGGVTNATRVSGGVETVDDGGSALGGVVLSGGDVLVYSGGLAADRILAGGIEEVFSGGVASGTAVSSGGVEVIGAGAIAEAVTVSSGGEVELELVLSSGQSFTLPASPQSATVSLDGITVQAGGALELSDVTVQGGATLSLASGAFVGGATVLAGGSLLGPGGLADYNGLDDFGLISGVTLGTLTSIYVESGGRLDAVGVEGELAEIDVETGGVDSGVQLGVAGGGAQNAANLENVLGSSIATTIRSNNEQEVFSGGFAGGAVVSALGLQEIDQDAVGSGTRVLSGGVLYLFSGALPENLHVSSGGYIELFTFGAVLSSGASAYVGETLSTTSVAEGVLSSGAFLSLDTVEIQKGGVLTFNAGAVAGDLTIDAGATISRTRRADRLVPRQGLAHRSHPGRPVRRRGRPLRRIRRSGPRHHPDQRRLPGGRVRRRGRWYGGLQRRRGGRLQRRRDQQRQGAERRRRVRRQRGRGQRHDHLLRRLRGVRQRIAGVGREPRGWEGRVRHRDQRREHPGRWRGGLRQLHDSQRRGAVDHRDRGGGSPGRGEGRRRVRDRVPAVRQRGRGPGQRRHARRRSRYRRLPDRGIRRCGQQRQGFGRRGPDPFRRRNRARDRGLQRRGPDRQRRRAQRLQSRSRRTRCDVRREVRRRDRLVRGLCLRLRNGDLGRLQLHPARGHHQPDPAGRIDPAERRRPARHRGRRDEGRLADPGAGRGRQRRDGLGRRAAERTRISGGRLLRPERRFRPGERRDRGIGRLQRRAECGVRRRGGGCGGPVRRP